jgi:hypothetical protein
MILTGARVGQDAHRDREHQPHGQGPDAARRCPAHRFVADTAFDVRILTTLHFKPLV